MRNVKPQGPGQRPGVCAVLWTGGECLLGARVLGGRGQGAGDRGWGTGSKGKETGEVGLILHWIKQERKQGFGPLTSANLVLLTASLHLQEEVV